MQIQIKNTLSMLLFEVPYIAVNTLTEHDALQDSDIEPEVKDE